MRSNSSPIQFMTQAMSLFVLPLSLAMVIGCGGPTEEPPADPDSAPEATTPTDDVASDLTLAILEEGLSTPESAEFDPASGDVFISNIVIDEEIPIPDRYWLDDGTGFITRIAADGTVKEKSWRQEELDKLLDGPKGITLAEEKIYICDNASLVVVPLDESEEITTIEIPDAEYLNDVCVKDGVVYTSDTKRALVYQVDGDTITEIKGPESINGITFLKDKLYAISFATPDLFLLDVTGEKPAEGLGLTDLYKKGDGIEPLEDGSLLITDFEGGKVVHLAADLKTKTVIYDAGPDSSLADFGIDHAGGKLFIPSVLTDKLYIIDFKKALEKAMAAVEAATPDETPEG